MKHILCAALMLLVSFTEATASEPFCVGTPSPRTVVVFGNGVMNDHDDAVKSREKIEMLLHATLPPEEFALLDFDLAENKTYGLLNDLYESAKQKALSDNVAVSFWRWLGGIDMMPDFFQNEMLRLAGAFDFSSIVGSADLNEHLDLYNKSIKEGKNVVTIAHSQGNFFANAEWNILFSELSSAQMQGFGIVSVANPTSFVGGDGPYTTLEEDLVIKAIQQAIQGFGLIDFDLVVNLPLEPNATNEVSTWISHDILKHSFVGEYLAPGSNTVDIITQNIVTMMHSRVHPPVYSNETAISVTLTPGAGQDMDLHVYEHNGAQATSLSPVGTAGKFDLIDSAGYGPERYVASCSELTDSYTIGVVYARGQGPSTAVLEIKAGNIVSKYTIPILSSGGILNYQIIIPVAGVTAVHDPVYGGYSFSVHNTFGTPLSSSPPTFSYRTF